MESTVPTDLPALWLHCLEQLEDVTSPASRQWLVNTAPVGFNDDTIILAAPHSFAREYLDTNMSEQLTATLSTAIGRDLDVVITVAPGAANLRPLDDDVDQVEPGSGGTSGQATNGAAMAPPPAPPHHPYDTPDPRPHEHRSLRPLHWVRRRRPHDANGATHTRPARSPACPPVPRP